MMKKIDCDGVGDNGGFFEIEKPSSSELLCNACLSKMELSTYHDMSIVEYPNCGYDDKDDRDVLIKRYGKNN
ncbi:MAG: hypothetical protein QM500_08595 [Methylococcales bacterium]